LAVIAITDIIATAENTINILYKLFNATFSLNSFRIYHSFTSLPAREWFVKFLLMFFLPMFYVDVILTP